jgi:hypothetical protein
VLTCCLAGWVWWGLQCPYSHGFFDSLPMLHGYTLTEEYPFHGKCVSDARGDDDDDEQEEEGGRYRSHDHCVNSRRARIG